MTQRRIHLIAPAGPCRDFFARVGVSSAAGLIELVQTIVDSDSSGSQLRSHATETSEPRQPGLAGTLSNSERAAGFGPRGLIAAATPRPAYRVTGNAALIDAAEDHDHGGRIDDRARAADIQEALADPATAAVIMLRGGAWFTRILPHIDFSVLDRRTSRVAVFGFSELTPLINVVGAHANALGIYSMGPVFLGYGLKRFASRASPEALARAELQTEAGRRTSLQDVSPGEWMRGELPGRFREFFRNCAATIEGRSEPTTIHARLVRGRVDDAGSAIFVGGNLTVLSVMVGSRYADAVEPMGRWLLLEDYNDKAERFDRYLSHVTLAGFWERCAGVLLGDFHQEHRDLTNAVVEMLNYHLPEGREVPVAVTNQVGHTWPMTPVPLHVPAAVERTGDCDVSFTWSGEQLGTIVPGE